MAITKKHLMSGKKHQAHQLANDDVAQNRLWVWVWGTNGYGLYGWWYNRLALDIRVYPPSERSDAYRVQCGFGKPRPYGTGAHGFRRAFQVAIAEIEKIASAAGHAKKEREMI